MIELTEYRFINISLTSSNDAVGGGYRLMKYMKSKQRVALVRVPFYLRIL
jgi:hypothetical protein